jgi:tRNA A37 threonylcarbamoyltransferase TsaD
MTDQFLHQHGHFISRYYVETTLERPHTGLALDGGHPHLTLCADDMELVKLWLRQRLAEDTSVL